MLSIALSHNTSLFEKVTSFPNICTILTIKLFSDLNTTSTKNIINENTSEL
ncbi:hypothetical protein J32TS6_15000 [Virgibacillus pantothenticus]|nr:hypothetical protein J32TS6_15000 [Virgibacillus pantothenticus]